MKKALIICGALLFVSLFCFTKFITFGYRNNTSKSINKPKEKEDTIINPSIENLDIWKEYKCIHIMRSDRLPYDDCYIIISNNKFYYFRDKQLLEEDSLTLDKSYSFTVYRRQNKPDDIIQFLTEDGDSIALFRYKFDGEREFFVRYGMDSIPKYIRIWIINNANKYN